MERISIFTGDLNYAVRKGIIELLNELPLISIQIIVFKPKKHLKSVLFNQYSNLKRNGWRWISYQFSEITKVFFSQGKASVMDSSIRPGKQYDANSIHLNNRISVVTTEDIHNLSTLQTVLSFSPDLGIALAAPILKEKLFSIPKKGTINLHKGMVPHYRGMPPGFWELWNQEKVVGCTIHQVNSKLDCGDILLQEEIPVKKYSTLRGIQLILDEVGIRLTCKAAKQISVNSQTYTKQSQNGTTYRKPTLKQYALLHKQYRPLQSDSTLRKVIKSVAQFSYLNIYVPIRNLKKYKSNSFEICVLLYHRINDDLRDSVTVGIEQFEKQMRYISKRYHILSIDQIINGEIPRTDNRKPYLAVTFDDGYLDNYENAVPILLRHEIPAAFFISTGIIGEQIGFQHDLSKLGYALPNMTWDNLREMKQHGFTIGSHTVSHLNCANNSLMSVKDELIESMRKIQTELNQRQVIFAYPFGGRRDINESALKLVKDCGYKGCLSAYGGTNDQNYDPYNILRKGIDFNFSHLSFISKIHGW